MLARPAPSRLGDISAAASPSAQGLGFNFTVWILEPCLILTALVGVFHRHLAADTEGPQDMPGAFQSSKK